MKLNLTREQVETIRSLRREEYDDDMLTADWLALEAENKRLTERLERLNKLDEMCDTLRRQMNDPANSKDDILTMITSFKINYARWRADGEQK